MLRLSMSAAALALLAALVWFACATDGAPPVAAPTARRAAVWESREQCLEALRARRFAGRPADRLRVVTWNIRWFPDGKPGKTPVEEGGTDLGWLACSIAWLEADVIALNEVKLVEHGIAAMDGLMARLGELTGAAWQWTADRCPDPTRQHLALAYRTDRARFSFVETRGEVDPTVNKSRGTPECPGLLRPALTAYVSSTKPAGVDFHVAVVHLDSGREERDFGNRQQSWAGLEQLAARRMEVAPDRDWLVMGDFNTMGCSACGLADSAAELRALEDAVLRQALPLRLASRDVGCTEYFRDRGTTLDHMLVSTVMEEAGGVNAAVSGICSALACRPTSRKDSPVLEAISDHCPLVIDLYDRDQDPAGSATR